MTTPKIRPSFEYFYEVVDHLHGLGHAELWYQESELGQSHIFIRRIFLPSGKEMARVRISNEDNKWLLFGDENNSPKELPADAIPINEEMYDKINFASQNRSWTRMFNAILEEVALKKRLLSPSLEDTKPREPPRI